MLEGERQSLCRHRVNLVEMKARPAEEWPGMEMGPRSVDDGHEQRPLSTAIVLDKDHRPVGKLGDIEAVLLYDSGPRLGTVNGIRLATIDDQEVEWRDAIGIILVTPDDSNLVAVGAKIDVDLAKAKGVRLDANEAVIARSVNTVERGDERARKRADACADFENGSRLTCFEPVNEPVDGVRSSNLGAAGLCLVEIEDRCPRLVHGMPLLSEV